MLTSPSGLNPPAGAGLSLAGVVSDGRCVRASFAGEVDMSTSPAFTTAIADVMRSHPGLRVELDLAGIRFLDSSGIRTLLHGRRRAAEEGRHLVVVDAQPRVLRVLEITGVLKLLTGPAESRPSRA